MAIFTTNRDAILRDVLASLKEAGFTQTDAASGVMLVCSPLIDALARTLTSAEELYNQSQLSSAEGTALDTLGEKVGLARQRPVKAYSAVQKFYVPGGQTYSEAGGSGTGIIPAGTVVYSPTKTNLQFVTLEDAVFGPDSTQSIVAIEALNAGSAYKAGANALTAHSYSTLQSIIWTTNLDSIDSGEDVETDSNFRYRISRRIEDLSSPTEDGIAARLLLVPGVRDIVLDSSSRGPGTLTITVLTNLSPASQTVLDQVLVEAKRIAAAGTAIDVKAPREIPISIYIVVTPEVSGVDITDIVYHEVALYIANLTVGQTLEVSDLINVAYQAGAGDAAVAYLAVNGEAKEIQNINPGGDARFVLDTLRVGSR